MWVSFPHSGTSLSLWAGAVPPQHLVRWLGEGDRPWGCHGHDCHFSPNSSRAPSPDHPSISCYTFPIAQAEPLRRWQKGARARWALGTQPRRERRAGVWRNQSVLDRVLRKEKIRYPESVSMQPRFLKPTLGRFGYNTHFRVVFRISFELSRFFSVSGLKLAK